jgi:hypothetical protein
MRTALLHVAIVTLGLAAPAGCGKKEHAGSAAAPAAGAIVVQIGHVAPLSGPQAHYGKDNENGVRMAIEELNAQNVQIGGKPARIALVAGDDAGDPRQGTATARRPRSSPSGTGRRRRSNRGRGPALSAAGSRVSSCTRGNTAGWQLLLARAQE